jgi:hypothetical protein
MAGMMGGTEQVNMAAGDKRAVTMVERPDTAGEAQRG